MPAHLTLTDERGRSITLGPAFASGGEGAVHPVVGEPTLVAKVYKKPSKLTAEKLRTMLAFPANSPIRPVAAWPSGLLMQGGTVAGFLMSKLEKFEPAQHLYNPAQRLKYFPRHGWRRVVITAQNCAGAFDEVHKTGCLVGDVNQSNVLINAQGKARLIDCDSFQVPASGKHYLCEVGVAHYTPPELQGQNFRSVVRTLNHDRFGLAVLMFQFLFVGRHPYAGVFLGRGDLAFEDAIREYRFAYGPRSRTVEMDPPPFTPTLTDVPPELGILFGRAFERGSERPNVRPTALEWFNALGRLSSQLHTCSSDPGHECWSGAGGCVWCRIAAARGPDYFFGVGDSPTTFTVDEGRIGPYLARLTASRLLDFPYDRDSYAPSAPPTPEELPEDLDTHKTLTAILTVVTGVGAVLTLLGCFSRVALLMGILVTLIFGIWLWLTVANSPYRRERTRRRLALRAAKWELDRLEDRWDDYMRTYERQHDALTQRINVAVARCRNLSREHQAEQNALESRREELARAQHLKSCFLSDADIPNVGEGRKQTLAAYNILTAYDVDTGSVTQIKGFGPKLAGNLLAWQDEMARQFRFDKSKGVPETELRGLAIKYRKQQDAYFREIEQALTELQGLEPKVRKELTALVPELRAAVAEWWQADEDVRALHQL